MKKSHLFTVLLLPLLLFACNEEATTDDASSETPPNPTELIDVDKAFSQSSLENGLAAAFIEYCADNGVLLRDNKLPIAGAANIQEYMNSLPDSMWTVTWEPSSAFIASSGDMGYTIGLWQAEVKLDSPLTSQGAYVTIWQKGDDGNWKYVLDAGTEGLLEKAFLEDLEQVSVDRIW